MSVVPASKLIPLRAHVLHGTTITQTMTSAPSTSQSYLIPALALISGLFVLYYLSSGSAAGGIVCQEPSTNGRFPGICGYPASEHNFRHIFVPGPAPR